MLKIEFKKSKIPLSGQFQNRVGDGQFEKPLISLGDGEAASIHRGSLTVAVCPRSDLSAGVTQAYRNCGDRVNIQHGR